MSVGYNKDRGAWNADCIFCKKDLGDWPSFSKAERVNDHHLVVCPELDEDDRRAAFSGPRFEEY